MLYRPNDDEMRRADEAMHCMKLCMACSILGVVVQIIMLVMIVGRNGHWWWFLLLSWVCLGVAEWYKAEARRIYPEGFRDV